MLVDGLGVWERGSFRECRSSGTLISTWASIPSFLMGHAPTSSATPWTDEPERYFGAGADFVVANETRSQLLITYGRWMCAPTSLLGALICFVWGSSVYGPWSGLAACCLWCFSPWVLGNSAIIAPDAHVASLFSAVTLLFWIWLRKPCWWWGTIVLLIGLGGAICLDPRLTIVIPFWIVGNILKTLFEVSRDNSIRMRSAQIGIGTVVAMCLVMAGNQDFDAWIHGAWLDGRVCRHAKLGFSECDFDGSSSAWVCMPLGVLALLLVRVAVGGVHWWNGARIAMTELVFGLLCVILISISCLAHCDREQVFYGMVAAPAVIVWCSGLFTNAFWGNRTSQDMFLKLWGPRVAFSLLAWSVGSSLASVPDSLSYANEIGTLLRNEPSRGQAGFDMGQGLGELERFLDHHPDIGPVGLGYFGPFPAEAIGARACSIDWSIDKPLNRFSHVAISHRWLCGGTLQLPWYDGGRPEALALHRRLARRPPERVFGGGLFLYRLSSDDRESVPVVASSQIGQQSQLASIDRMETFGVDELPRLDDVVGRESLYSVSGMLHVLILERARAMQNASRLLGVDPIEFLTNDRIAKRFLAESPFVVTVHGLRYRMVGAADGFGRRELGESHRDQALAVFASLELPKDLLFTVDDSSFRMQDLIAESVANFNEEQAEIAWTATAYAGYLPPDRAWTNRFGKRTSFDDLVAILLAKDLAKESCAGMHLVQALSAISRADDRFGLLKADSRIRVKKFLLHVVDCLERYQLADGNWPYRWWIARDDDQPDAHGSQIVVAGHALEFLNQQPKVSPQALGRGTSWMMESLRHVSEHPESFTVCPLTHSIHSVHMSFENRARYSPLAEVFR